jgi:hypothetical protein
MLRRDVLKSVNFILGGLERGQNNLLAILFKNLNIRIQRLSNGMMQQIIAELPPPQAFSGSASLNGLVLAKSDKS